MSEGWALRMGRSAAGSLGSLRLVPGVQVLEHDSEVWLRGDRADNSLRRRLLVLPESHLFAVQDSGEIVPHGARVPVEKLPQGQWQLLSRWLTAVLEPAAFPGRIDERARLSMVPTTEEREANVLLSSLEAWASYASKAPQVRLQRWRFAVSAGRKAAIYGTPLPPLPGLLFCDFDSVAAQAGWAWTPAIEPGIVFKALGLSRGDLALLHADGSWEHLRAGGFVAATRSAVRLSLGGRDDGR